MAEQPSNEMSSSLGDSWTVINDKNLDAKCVPGCSLHSEGSHVEDIPIEKRDEVTCFKKANEVDESLDPPSSRSSNSDIAVIDEDDEDDKPGSVEPSLASADSLFSFLTSSTVSKSDVNRTKGDFDALGEDLSDFSSVTSHIREELNSEVDFNPGAKHYVHVPNARLNLALNMVVVLAVTAVLGLGVGNFIGWSTMQQRYQDIPAPEDSRVPVSNEAQWQPTPIQALRLKKLQDELLLCIQQQKETGSKICLQDALYWKEQFAQLFEENQDLQENLRNSQVRGDESDLILETSRCPNQAKGDFQNLKLDLLIDQMDHLQLLKSYEEIRMQEKLSKEKLKKLEEENEELKMKLVEEEEEDEVMLNELVGKIQKLKDENEVLKVKLRVEEEEEQKDSESHVPGTIRGTSDLTSLEEQVRGLRVENKELKTVLQNLQIDQQTEERIESAASNRMDDLKGQIDQVFVENQELRNLIQSMQEKRTMDKVSLNDQQKLYVNELKHENEDLKVEIGKMRYKNFATETPEQDDDESEMMSMQEQLNTLQEVLQQEKGEVEKWKQMYEDMKSKANTPQDKDTNGNQGKSPLPNIDWAEVVAKLNVPDLADKLGNMGSAVSQILEDIWKMNESVGQQFKDVQKDLYTKWEELRVQMEENLHAKGIPKREQESHKKEEKMSEILLNSMKKLYRSGVRFMFSNGKSAEDGGNRAGKIMDSFKKIMGKLNNKWNAFKEAVAKSVEDPVEDAEISENDNEEEITIREDQYDESGSDAEYSSENWYPDHEHNERSFADSYDDEDYESENWFMKRAESREKHHETAEAPESKFTDWDLRRAKGRKKQRQMEQSDDDNDGNDDDDDDDDDDDFDVKRSVSEKRHKEKKKDLKKGGDKTSKGRHDQRAKRESKKKENSRKKKEKSHRNGT